MVYVPFIQSIFHALYNLHTCHTHTYIYICLAQVNQDLNLMFDQKLGNWVYSLTCCFPAFLSHPQPLPSLWNFGLNSWTNGHLVQMYIQKVRTQKPILWTAERRISRASCPWRFVCNTFWSFSFHTVSSCLTIFPMTRSDQLQLFIPQPLSNMDMMDDKIMHMHHVSTISFCLRFEVQPTWSAIGSISTMACVLHFHPAV